MELCKFSSRFLAKADNFLLCFVFWVLILYGDLLFVLRPIGLVLGIHIDGMHMSTCLRFNVLSTKWSHRRSNVVKKMMPFKIIDPQVEWHIYCTKMLKWENFESYMIHKVESVETVHIVVLICYVFCLALINFFKVRCLSYFSI